MRIFLRQNQKRTSRGSQHLPQTATLTQLLLKLKPQMAKRLKTQKRRKNLELRRRTVKDLRCGQTGTTRAERLKRISSALTWRGVKCSSSIQMPKMPKIHDRSYQRMRTSIQGML